MKKNTKENPVGNAGFSLIELILVVAILSILLIVIGPSYLKYVEKTKRTVDADTALKVRDAIERVQAIDAPGTSGGSYLYTAGVSWNKDSKMSENPTDFLQMVFWEVGKVPVSVVDKDFFWTAIYNSGSGEVKGIYLGTHPGEQKYELYPDNSAWLEKGAD